MRYEFNKVTKQFSSISESEDKRKKKRLKAAAIAGGTGAALGAGYLLLRKREGREPLYKSIRNVVPTMRKIIKKTPV